jgi:hypothetical protein
MATPVSHLLVDENSRISWSCMCVNTREEENATLLDLKFYDCEEYTRSLLGCNAHSLETA